MKTIKKILLTSILSIFSLANLSVFSTVSAQNVYDSVFSGTIDSASLESALIWDQVRNGYWDELFNKQVEKIIGYVIDVFIVIWIAIAFFGGYEIMTSDKEEKMKEWIRLVAFGVIWIIIMVSALFLAKSLVWDSGIIAEEFDQSYGYRPNWIQFADNLYKKIMYPFIKIALYFAIWALFFVMAGKVIGFVTATDDSAKKKAWWIIIRCVVWILIIMWSKQIVEAVMWSQDEVLRTRTVVDGRVIWEPTRIDDQWKPLVKFGSIPLIAQVINWVMWLTMFAIVVLIIIQWYKIFTKPDDPKTREGLKKAILYILIWVLVIGATYVISKTLVVNNVSIETVTWGGT